MSALVAAEALKLRTTRTFYGVVGAALAIVLLITLAAALAADFEGSEEPGRDLISIAALAQTFALVLGVLAVSTEFRHGTITPSLLVAPRRARLLVAKLVAHLLAGLLLGLLAFGLTAAIVALALGDRGIGLGVDTGQVLGMVVGGAAATALFALIGVGLGALLRNQVGALVIGIGWVFVIEPLITVIPGTEDAVRRFGLGGLAEAVGSTPFDESTELLAPLPAALVLLGYGLILALAGAAVLARRDVSA